MQICEYSYTLKDIESYLFGTIIVPHCVIHRTLESFNAGWVPSISFNSVIWFVMEEGK